VRNTTVEACLTVSRNGSTVIVKEGYTAVSRYVVKKCYLSSMCAAGKNNLRCRNGCTNVSITVRLTVGSLGSAKVHVRSEGDNLVHITEETLIVAKNARVIKTSVTDITLILTGKTAYALAFLVAIVVSLFNKLFTNIIVTGCGVVSCINSPNPVVAESINKNCFTNGTSYFGGAIAVILVRYTFGISVTTVFTEVTAILGRLMYAHLFPADVTVVVLIVIVTSRYFLPAVLTGVTPTLNVLAYRIAANVTFVILIFVSALGNGSTAVVTVVSAFSRLVVAHSSTANITRVIEVFISTDAKSFAANVTFVILIFVSALGNNLTAVLTCVFTLCSLVSTHLGTANVTCVIKVGIGTGAERNAAVSASVAVFCRYVRAYGLFEAYITHVILVFIHVFSFLNHHGILNGVLS